MLVPLCNNKGILGELEVPNLMPEISVSEQWDNFPKTYKLKKLASIVGSRAVVSYVYIHEALIYRISMQYGNEEAGLMHYFKEDLYWLFSYGKREYLDPNNQRKITLH